MRVVIDARPALGSRPTGVGRYANELIRHLPPADPETDYLAWFLHARGLLQPRRFFSGISPNLSEHPSRFPARVFQPVSSRIGFPRVEWLCGEFDLLMATNFLPPATGRPERVVPVVHDLAFVRHPETAPHVDDRWRTRLAAAVTAAPAVIVPSAAVRDDLLGFAPAIDPSRAHVVHHGTDQAAFTPAPSSVVDDVRRRFGIAGPYVLFVGGIEPRKNLSRLVKAFASLGSGDTRLVLAGGPVPWFPKGAADLDAAVEALPAEIRERVIRTGYVSDADRVALLSGAEILAYPSLAEGFGFPVLEGFAANVPVLTSTTSSLPEVAGDAAVLIDPSDPDAIAAGLRELLEDDDLRAMLRAKGLSRVAGFTWEKCARETAAVLREAARAAG